MAGPNSDVLSVKYMLDFKHFVQKKACKSLNFYTDYMFLVSTFWISQMEQNIIICNFTLVFFSLFLCGLLETFTLHMKLVFVTRIIRLWDCASLEHPWCTYLCFSNSR